MDSVFVDPQVDKKKLAFVHCLSTDRHLHSRDPIDQKSYRMAYWYVPVTHREVEKMDRRLSTVLKGWGFPETKWNNDLQSAAVELVLNAVDHSCKKVDDYLHVQYLTCNGRRYRYFWVLVSTDGPAIDISTLQFKLPYCRAWR